MELKIVGWTHFDCEYPTPKLGQDEFVKVLSLIQDEIAEKGYMFAGQDHQNSSTGVPVFSDGTCFRASWRAWGAIMARLFTKGDGEDCTYMDFYMSLGKDAVMPPHTNIDVKPAVVQEESVGCTLKQDREMIEQSVQMGMPFMTMDVVLQNYYNKLKDEQ